MSLKYKREEKLVVEEDQFVKPKKAKELQDFYRFQVISSLLLCYSRA